MAIFACYCHGNELSGMNQSPATQPRIALAVHGRFHAFDLANGLARLGAQPHLFSNYPAWAVRKYGFDSPLITTFARHGVLQRLVQRLPRYAATTEPLLHRMFGQWAATQIDPAQFDILHLWSGIALESLESLHSSRSRPLLTLKRGSAHIAAQHEILLAEEERAQTPLDRPSPWIIQRETSEYELSDLVCCLSRFAYQSFLQRGVHAHRLAITPLGVNTAHFRPSPESLARRSTRILDGGPLRVLTVGTFSFRKGILDYQRIVQASQSHCEFRFVGDVPPEGRPLAKSLQGKVAFADRVPQLQLAPHLAWADVFLFPTLEDGFAAVLNQAAAAGLPILATTNCSAPDFVEPGKTGWILPIRQPEAFLEKLAWCDQHRHDLANMADRMARTGEPCDWQQAAALLLRAVQTAQSGPQPELSVR